jgi:replicative DNA helicase
MTTKDLALRAMCSQGRVDNAILRADTSPKQDDWGRITKGVSLAASMDFDMVKMARPTVEEIKAICRSLNRKKPYDIIVIDHLHLLAHKKTANEVQGIGDSTAELKGLALELEVPILLMAQLNRGNAKENRAPSITDLRGSGAIEQDSDRVLLIHRTPELDKQGIAKLFMPKNRGGRAGVAVNLKNSLQFYRFDNAEGQYSGYEEMVSD